MKKNIAFLTAMAVFVIALARISESEADMARLTGKRAVMIIAEKNFRDEELLRPKALLEKEGVRVDMASTTKSEVKGSLGAKVRPNMLISDINPVDYDAVIFIGGSGSPQYWDDSAAHAVAKEAAASGKLVAAICSASVTLANAGILTGKNATVWHLESRMLTDKGVVYTGRPVEVDGNIVTADGPASSEDFARALIKKLGE